MGLENEIFKLGRFAARSWGHGPKVMLCLHGFGGDGRQFAALFPEAWAGWRLVAVDLPFFGGSSWNGAVCPKDLQALLAALQAKFGLKTLHIMAFSLGARLALGLVAQATLPIKSVILISPDGLRQHPIYRLAVHTQIGKWVFSKCMQRPGLLLFFNRSLYNLRIHDKAQYQFVRRKLRDKMDRKLLYQVWMGYRHWPPKLNSVAIGSEKAGTKWHVIWGKQDKITPPHLGKKFLRRIPKAKSYFLTGGHFLLRLPAKEVITLIESILKKP